MRFILIFHSHTNPRVPVSLLGITTESHTNDKEERGERDDGGNDMFVILSKYRFPISTDIFIPRVKVL
jgi:hypothetical protein